jgi:agmatine deiminase
MSQDEIEDELKVRLGVHKVIWLPGVRGEDITDGHIDGSIRFVRPGVLMTDFFEGGASPWVEAMAEVKSILRKATDAKGRAFEMVEIPWAHNPRSIHPDFFPGYANFYIGNGAIYTPQFGDKPADDRAVESLGRLFPNRKIVALNVDRIYENAAAYTALRSRNQRNPDDRLEHWFGVSTEGHEHAEQPFLLRGCCTPNSCPSR